MYGMYHTFNFLTGYTQTNPSVQSIEWRLIVLESVAGVPGFVAAGKCESFPHQMSLADTLQSNIISPVYLTMQVSDIFALYVL